ncbi:hypothetical protein BH10BAC1_BH10BAC1_13940 [soil metagenome]
MESIVSVLYITSLTAAFWGGLLALREKSFIIQKKRTNIINRIPLTTLAISGILIAFLVLQLLFPSILISLDRNSQLVLKGEWWRIVTALFVQDRGLPGGIFNITTLLFIGTMAEQYWNIKSWLIIFFAGGISSELVALLWQPNGAGNSVANFSLAAGVCLYCLKGNPTLKVRILAIVFLSIGILLLIIKDIHGFALLSGFGLALILIHQSEKYV